MTLSTPARATSPSPSLPSTRTETKAKAPTAPASSTPPMHGLKPVAVPSGKAIGYADARPEAMKPVKRPKMAAYLAQPPRKGS